jgi:predicted nucleic acid-binding protein
MTGEPRRYTAVAPCGLSRTHRCDRIHIECGTEIALKSAENYRALRHQGITVRKTIDCLIATFVIERGFTLLHSDRDFDPFEMHLGLRVAR